MKSLTRVTALAVTIGACLAFAGSASAATSPGYGEFTTCPSKSVDPAITACISNVVDGGHLQLGNTDTPITDPIRLVGALKPGPSGGTFFLGSFDGGTQQVPGGIIGISGLDWLINLFPGNLLKLYAESELAGPIGSPLVDPFALPLKVKLVNPLLSSNCYIGSNTNPIALNLTKGETNPPPPNVPIRGHSSNLFPDPALPGVVRSPDNVLVDNAFAAPGATGCGLLGLNNAVVNYQAGLPSPAGTNEAIQEVDVAIGAVQAVYQPAGIETP
jgi:hypothetical protein